MLSPGDLDIEILGLENEEVLTGRMLDTQILIKPKVSFNVERFSFDLLVELRGKNKPQSEVLWEGSPVPNTHFEAGKTYAYPIQYYFKDLESYLGKNFSIGFYFQFYLEIDPPLKGRKKSKNALNIRIPLNVRPLSNYAIEKLEEPKLKAPGGFGALFFICLTSIIAASVWLYSLIKDAPGFSSQHYWIIGAIGLLVAIGLAALFIYDRYDELAKKHFGNLVLEVSIDDGNKLHTNINYERWNHIKQLKLKFFVEEEIVDQRGTSDYTYKSVYYESQELKFAEPKAPIDATFDLPGHLSSSLSFQNARISSKATMIVQSQRNWIYIYDIPLRLEKDITQS